MNQVIFSKKTDHWATPSKIYETFMKLGYFDPCPLYSKVDGLSIKWRDFNFVNPPFSQTAKWVDKAIKENKENKEIVFLIPSRTDTIYFHKLLKHGAQVYFVKGRLKYNDKGTAPFPSIFVVLIKQSYCEAYYHFHNKPTNFRETS